MAKNAGRGTSKKGRGRGSRGVGGGRGERGGGSGRGRSVLQSRLVRSPSPINLLEDSLPETVPGEGRDEGGRSGMLLNLSSDSLPDLPHQSLQPTLDSFFLPQSGQQQANGGKATANRNKKSGGYIYDTDEEETNVNDSPENIDEDDSREMEVEAEDDYYKDGDFDRDFGLDEDDY